MKIFNFVTGFAAAVAVCVFLYACIRMIASQGQEDKATAAKKTAFLALVGLFLALASWGLLAFVKNFVSRAVS